MMATIALILAAALALPAAAIAAWRFWSAVPTAESGGARALDAVWTLAPLALLIALIVAAA